MNNKLSRTLISEARYHVLKLTPSQQKEYGRWIKNRIFNNEIEYSRSIGRISQREKKFVKIYRFHSEIVSSLDSLKTIPYLLEYQPTSVSYKKHNISRIWYVRYHFENHLQEIYLLRTRVNGFLELIIKLLRKRRGAEKSIHEVERVRKMFNDSLCDVTKTRGIHVHQRRYSDKNLDRMDTLELFSSIPVVQVLSDIEFHRERKRLFEIVLSNSRGLERVIDTVYNQLYPIVFGKVLYRLIRNAK